MRIVLVSDTHLAPRATAFRRNWEVIARWIEDVRPDWVVHLGDITVDGVSDADELGAARAVFDSLTVPIRFVPGNHNVGDNPLATGRSADHPLDLARLAAYRDLFGSDRWALDAGDWRIVALNAQLLGTGIAEEEAQFRWLEARLSERQGPLGLLLHKPLFRDGPDDTEVHVRYVPAEPRRRLLALLARSDLRFVATGHVHQSRRITIGGIVHAWVPSTAYCFPDAMQERIGEKTVGALMLELEGHGHRFTLVTPAGLARHDILDHPEVYPQVKAITTASCLSPRPW